MGKRDKIKKPKQVHARADKQRTGMTGVMDDPGAPVPAEAESRHPGGDERRKRNR